MAGDRYPNEITRATWCVDSTSNERDGTRNGWYPSFTETTPTVMELHPGVVITYGDKPEREENMRSLFRITVVNPKTEEIYPDEVVIAKDRENALLKAVLAEEVRANPDQFDILVEVVGDVRAKKEVQRVRQVTSDDE